MDAVATAAWEAAKSAVREAADIVEIIGEQVALKRAGTNFTGLCPFHAEKTPSFSVSPQKGFYYCFGCGAKGDVFDYVMRTHHMDFPEALKWLAERYRISLPERRMGEAERAALKLKEDLFAVYEAATALYETWLADEKLGAPAREYLRGRGVPEDAAARYRLGFAPDPEAAGWDRLARTLTAQGFAPELLVQAGLAANRKSGGLYDRFRNRVLFPLADMSGRVTAFGGRNLGADGPGNPKYYNSPESPIFSKSRQLFGLHPHKEAIRKAGRALVVEGNFDLLSLAARGVENVVAPLGTALTREHVHALHRYCSEVILFFDADAAGLRAAMRGIPFFLEEGLAARVALLPAGHDPDSYVREQGKTAVEALVERALPLAEFALDRLIAAHGLTLGGKARIVAELKPLIRAAGREQRDLMVAHFAGRLGVSPDYFSGRDFARPPQAPPPQPHEEPPGPDTLFDRPPEQSAPPPRSALHNLTRQEKQLLDFLLFWPEYCTSLAEAGVVEAVDNPAFGRLVALMLDCGADAASGPEYLLEAPLDPSDRAYVVERLTRQPLAEFFTEHGDPEEAARGMCAQLLDWVRLQQRRQSAARLRRELLEAERRGDTRGALDLLKSGQMDVGQKK